MTLESEMRKLAEEVKLATIEACAKIVEPKGPRPCDCEGCYCHNVGDAEAVAMWDSDTASAMAIRSLASAEPAAAVSSQDRKDA